MKLTLLLAKHGGHLQSHGWENYQEVSLINSLYFPLMLRIID